MRCVRRGCEVRARKSRRRSAAAGGAELDVDVLSGHRTAPLTHTAEPSLDADWRSLEELVAARANLNSTSRGRSVLLSRGPFFFTYQVRNVSR